MDTSRKGEEDAQVLSTQIETLWRDTRWYPCRDIQNEDRGLAELC